MGGKVGGGVKKEESNREGSGGTGQSRYNNQRPHWDLSIPEDSA